MTGGLRPGQRIKKYGKYVKTAGENTAYGPTMTTDPEGIVLKLVIDDGVLSRGHRSNIFSTRNKMMGAAVGINSKYKEMLCEDFTGGFNAVGDA